VEISHHCGISAVALLLGQCIFTSLIVVGAHGEDLEVLRCVGMSTLQEKKNGGWKWGN